MVVETSALVAMIRQEKGFEVLFTKMSAAPSRSISAASYLEACMVLIPLLGDDAGRGVDLFLAEAVVGILPVTFVQAQLARDAFLRYGKGRHPARLNFGDCLSYALAKLLKEPLLCIGNDFPQTDITIA